MLCIGSCRKPETPGAGLSLTIDQTNGTHGQRDLLSVAGLLAGHPSVAAAQAVLGSGISGLLIAPTTAGLNAYRCRGRVGIAADFAAHLGAPLPALWRLVETLPEALPEMLEEAPGGIAVETAEALLREPLPDGPVEQSVTLGTDGEVRYGLRVPLELAIFRCHFPVAPVVPGVEQVSWAIAFSRRHFALPAQFAGLDMLRFRRVMQPGSVLKLTLRSVTGSGALHFAFRSGKGPEDPLISDGRILFRDAGGD